MTSLSQANAGRRGRGRVLECDETTLERLRDRLSATTHDERALRVLLVLGHEIIRARLDAGPWGREPAHAGTPPTPARDGIDDYRALVSRVRERVRAHVPPGARVLVVSRGDDDLLVPGYDAAHFPQGGDGKYAGFYPADAEAAIAQLEAQRSAGAEFFVIPGTAVWWLDYYAGLSRHLLTTARTVFHDRDCLIFDLRSARAQREGPS